MFVLLTFSQNFDGELKAYTTKFLNYENIHNFSFTFNLKVFN